MSISTYFRPNIHQNGPEILGVKVDAKVFSPMPMGVSRVLKAKEYTFLSRHGLYFFE
jgi:hypothetical protein